jgi:hypothetical protein
MVPWQTEALEKAQKPFFPGKISLAFSMGSPMPQSARFDEIHSKYQNTMFMRFGINLHSDLNNETKVEKLNLPYV